MTNPLGRPPGPDCLTPAQLEAILENRAEAQVRQHAEACPSCQTELALLRDFATAGPRPDEVAAVREITKKLQSQAWKQEKVARPGWFDSLFAGRLCMPALGLAAMLVFAILVTRPDQSPRITESDTMRSATIAVSQPVGDLTAPPADFSWSPVAAAARYEVQLLEVDGHLLWTGGSTGTTLAVPAPLLPAGKTLYWNVTAYGAGGERLASSNRQMFRMVSR